MTGLKKLGVLALIAGLLAGGHADAAELNPVASHGSAASDSARFIVVFRETDQNRVVKRIKMHGGSRIAQFSQAQTSPADAGALIDRLQLTGAHAQQLTPSMHLLQLDAPLRGAAVDATLRRLRADARIAFADVDQRRYPHAVPNDPLFGPSSGASGQWYMLAPSAGDPAAVDAVEAWDLSAGSTGVVIADVDSGYRFDHPDLLRAGLGGKLLPGYDFVSGDLNSSNGKPLGTFLIANDGDGWDPDASDPGDWINASDQSNSLFPSSRCSVSTSSWHGTRVAGVLGALTNNGTGIAGISWNSYILPVRALGKCGGYDSDIMTGMQWAVGLSVSGVPDNPYPADIVNLSLGGDGSCSASYQSLITKLAGMGVLVVASAGNESGPVDSPGNCSGVLAVAGLRNVGTKVGYSSLGAQVGIAAPAGNCVVTNTCLKPIDTTSNAGTTVPADNIYTDESNPSLGTSFSAPIVSGIAALMRSVNGNLTPAQLIGRIQSSATPFPSATQGLPTCPSTSSSGECACVPGQCGAGMVNAFSAVKAALQPIAAVSFPARWNAGASVSVNGGPSLAACNQTLASYQWTASGGVTVTDGATAATVTASVNGSAAGTLTLTVTDGAGRTDTATVSVTAAGAATSVAPASAGSAAAACPTPLALSIAPPTIAVSFTPASVNTDTAATLTLTFSNSNPFVLTQSNFSHALPAGIDLAGSPTTTCSGHDASVAASGDSLSLSTANIPAQGSCKVSVGVKSSTPGTYVDTVGVNALSTGPGGSNATAAQGTLTVSAGTSSGSSSGTSSSTAGGGGGGGGDMDWLDMMLLAGILLVCRSHLGRGRPRP